MGVPKHLLQSWHCSDASKIGLGSTCSAIVPEGHPRMIEVSRFDCRFELPDHLPVVICLLGRRHVARLLASCYLFSSRKTSSTKQIVIREWSGNGETTVVYQYCGVVN